MPLSFGIRGSRQILFHHSFQSKRELNTREIMVPVKSGTLVMFPSWLPHFVPPNQGTTDRISISFNVMFESYGETISRPKWTFGQNPEEA